jgi:uncharacterized membrane protein HdeD (DUF308 family)
MSASPILGSSAPLSRAVASALAPNWWAIALRGVLGIVFGLIAFFMPAATMLSLVLVFSAYLLTDGIFAIIAAYRAARLHMRWGLLVIEGLVNIIAAVLALTWPALTVVAFVVLVAVWALLSGGLMLAAALNLDGAQGRWWLVLGGVASLLYGALLIAAPLIGAVVLTWWIGAYALIFGIALLALGFRLRAHNTSFRPA